MGWRESDFFKTSSLVKFLSRDLRILAGGIKTVAYIPENDQRSRGALGDGCEEIVMAPDAEIGDAGIDEKDISPSWPAVMRRSPKAEEHIPLAVALGMLDRDLKVLKVTTDTGTDYVLSDGLEN